MSTRARKIAQGKLLCRRKWCAKRRADDGRKLGQAVALLHEVIPLLPRRHREAFRERVSRAGLGPGMEYVVPQLMALGLAMLRKQALMPRLAKRAPHDTGRLR